LSEPNPERPDITCAIILFTVLHLNIIYMLENIDENAIYRLAMVSESKLFA
jgi:hypothetical protein